MKALILIGGEGTRLRPLTMHTLKCMVPIVNKHFFEYQLDMIKRAGIHEVILSICYLPEKIKKAIGNGSKYGMSIKYAIEKSPLGTGGAVKNSEKYITGPTVVMNGDVLTDIELKVLIEEHKKNRAAATIALHEVDDPTRYGLVETDKNGSIIKFLEKPKPEEITTKWINAGLYVFEKRILDYIPKNQNYSLERGLFPRLLAEKENFMSYKSKYYWLDIGKIEKYTQANYDILEGRFRFPGDTTPACGSDVIIQSSAKADSKAMLCGPAVIGPNTKIGAAEIHPLTIIGANCTVADGAKIERSIIWDNVKIGKNAEVRGCILGSGCVIHDNAVVHGAVLGNHANIPSFSKTGEI
jgi:mannose-1-phosphate guanylyltransferase